MKRSVTSLRWLAWCGALFAALLAAVYPIKDGLVRSVTVAGVLCSWFGLIGLLWNRRRARVALLIVTFLCAILVVLPGREKFDRETLRDRYVNRLRHYEGTRYIWGGEGSLGIDCSGLVRRGMCDALLASGIWNGNPLLVRRAFAMWWKDCTARALGEGLEGATRVVTSAPSLNALDHDLVRPGDLAVTRNGVHVLAYLGDRTWIEADPGLHRVVREHAPTSKNPWFIMPVNVVRWSVLVEH